MRALALVVLVPTLALAQFLPPGGAGAGGGGGTPDPSRNDTAASYNATGPGGYGLTGQVVLGACGAVRLVWLSPSGELRLCDGSIWRRVYTSAEGVLPNADVVVPGYTFVSQAPSGAYAFRAGNNGARVDFGAGGNDFIWSDGSQLISEGSLRIQANQSLTVDIIGSSNGGRIQLYPGSWVTYQGVGALATCDASAAGGLIRLTADGRGYWCDGTTALRLSRSLAPAAAVIDPASVPAGSCATQTATVTGAATTDVGVTVSPASALTSGLLLGNARVSAAGTVSFDVCNVTSAAIDQDSTTFNLTVLR